ncbi:unnamed protein product [Ceutorhynchus assimilis]|uniref:Transmembrane protein 218 n=1 Tax=Ceutorhynchus assimilis TaxID=467358 RepID=A0A9N9MPJ4_9CUCU|nr:unnamed protein product [Ceutorhynchus assimilis]
MATVGSIGIGLLILIILWIITLIVFVVGIKLQSNIAWIVLGLVSVFTITLLCIPTEKQQSQDLIELVSVEKDYIIIYKTAILTFLVVSALVGLSIFFIAHCIEPIRPKPIKTF